MVGQVIPGGGRLGMGGRIVPLIRRIGIATSAMLLLPAVVFAQAPWERAANNLALTFTGPLARALALVAIALGGLLFMFGRGGAKRQISRISFRPALPPLPPP